MSDFSHLRVLLVEDNELDARSMLRHLRSAPRTEFEVTRVSNLAQALLAIGTAEYDCILLDLSLPDSHGLMSVEALLASACEAPIVVLTGLDDPDVAVDAVERGAQDYLTKHSIDADRLVRAIRYAITRHRGESQLQLVNEQLDVMHDRERIARDLHDNVIQQLFATGMTLQAMASRTSDRQDQSRLLEAVDGIDEGIRLLREAIFGIHQAQEDLSLVEQIDKMATEAAQTLGFLPLVRAEAHLGSVPFPLQSDVLATVREALSNVAKHAGASAVEVTLQSIDDHLVLEVIDNGLGIRSVEEAKDELAGHGLTNMSQRANQHDGELTVRPGPGGGTAVRWTASLG